MTHYVIVYPDGCSKTLPKDEAVFLFMQKAAKEGLRMYPSVAAYEPPAELERRVAGPRNRPPYIDNLSQDQLTRNVQLVLQTTYRTAAKALGVSKFTVTRMMQKAGVSKRAERRKGALPA